jgi:hypothetical protein
MGKLAEALHRYVFGWKAYFGLAGANTRIWRKLDEWMRHRLRAIQLQQWKCGTMAYRECLKLGAPPRPTQEMAANCRRWWFCRSETFQFFTRGGLSAA